MRRLARGMCVMAVLGLAGCAELPASALKELVAAEGEYRQQRYDAAVSRLNGVLRQYPAHRDSAEGYYLRSLCQAKQGRKGEALSDALSCVKYARSEELKARAHATAGALLLEAGRSGEAIPHFVAAIGRLPERPPADSVQYQYALGQQHEGNWRDARASFAAVYQRYPGSDLADDARRMCEWPQDCFVIQCGAFREKPGAAALVQDLRKKGLSARMEAVSRSGETLNAVYVGRYVRYEQAQSALGSVKRHVSGAHVVP